MDEWSPRINIKYNKEMLRKKKIQNPNRNQTHNLPDTSRML